MDSENSKAKESLDIVIRKSRVHLYKPIQIAEILYHDRVKSFSNLDLGDLESYRTLSKGWRDDICLRFVGRTSTSSAKYQDDLFSETAVPPEVLKTLGGINRANNGLVEAYIYKAFNDKHSQLENALDYCLNRGKDDFYVKELMNAFWVQPGLRRSIDKVFEIIVYALFESIIKAIGIKVDIYYDNKDSKIVDEFCDFAEKVLSLSPIKNRNSLDAHFHRVGVTNAADRGLDMFANFGSVVQVKHLSLNEELAESIATEITVRKIIIVCKDSEKKVIGNLLTQIGWRDRIQSIITLEEIIDWYERALRGVFSDEISEVLLEEIRCQIKLEFPSVGNVDFGAFLDSRGYKKIVNSDWDVSW